MRMASRAGKRMAPDDRGGMPSTFPSSRTSSVEQFAQRFDQLQVHPRRQAADVVVALDRRRRPFEETDSMTSDTRSLREKAMSRSSVLRVRTRR